MNYAIRSGIAITATYAMNQSSRLLKSVDGKEREELLLLQQRLESKIQVISPAIDMIELIAARGNTSLESAVALTKSLRWDIQALGQRIGKAAASEEKLKKGSKSPQDRSQIHAEIKHIVQDIKALLVRIEDAVPLMNLAITTSGAKLSTNLPATVSPSRLLQASTFLTAGDTQYSMSQSQSQAVQIGPTFTLSMYMLFASHLRPHDEESMREATWKEVMHKAKLKVRRVPMDLYYDLGGQGQRPQFPGQAGIDEYAYQVLIIEDLDDGRVHTFEDNEPQPQSYEGLMTAGIREILPIHQISKIFYADTGKILNISTDGETNNPVLLLKRDLNALPPRRMMERDDVEEEHEAAEHEEPEDEEQAQLDAQLNGAGGPTSASFNSLHEDFIPDEWRLPPGLDPEWIAFEVYNEDSSSDSESEIETTQTSTTDNAVEKMAKLSIKDKRHTSSPSPSPSPSARKIISHQPSAAPETTTVSNPLFENIRTSLSLLETLLRLTSLQQFQQQSHLSISDELLNFFLEESSSTGAGGDEQHRQRLRSEARRRVGWDPYDESPVKRRGEDYQYGWVPGSPSRYPEGGGELYSPGGGSPGLRLRSRENTPETLGQQQQRASPGMKSEQRRPSGLRGVTPAYSDDSGFREASSPLARKSGSVSKDKKGAGSGTAE
ncbi:GTP-binding nuclear protein Ran-related protein [Penicillium lagena]|uniref:GTP-binding nuclear protein Ran-related protein n=1 Tax=Penicillium lagena TaxID=94218 RepID=UPI0025413302|nr:GTP-binding nuclear protein Ran-related protein [Penicillium lagena]KAJ5613004.1 GTP-binding nuclear protein Ran-related protein [Penicillium lagena]